MKTNQLRQCGKLLTKLLAILLCTVLTLIVPAYAVTMEGAYCKSDSEIKEKYIEAYGWEKDKLNSFSWSGKDGEEYERISTGYQREGYDDSLEALIAQLKEQGYNLDLTDGTTDLDSGKGGKGIVSVALGEVGQSRGIENGDNNVFYNEWFYGRKVSGSSYEWCAVFIAWCANECGYIDSGLFPKSASCAEHYKHLTSSQGFSAYKMGGIKQCGGSYEPVPGDIVFWYADGKFSHMGIVTDSNDTSLSITQGNCSNRVCTVSYNASTIKSSKGLSTGYIVHVEYPSFSFDGADGELQDTVYLFLTQELELSSGGACGVMGNLQVECAWNLNAIGDGGTSYGLCQWHNDRWKALIRFCQTNGYDSASAEGQLRYLEYELTQTSEGAVLPTLKSAQNSDSGARSAALSFARQFERCTADSYSTRQSYASSYWSIYGNK